MAARGAKNRTATARMTISPSRPVNRPIALSDDFQNQLALIRFLRRDVERIFHHFGRFLDAFFAGVVEAAEHGTRVYLFTDFGFEDHADSRIDGVFFAIAPGAHQRGGASDVLGIDDADITSA